MSRLNLDVVPSCATCAFSASQKRLDSMLGGKPKYEDIIVCRRYPPDGGVRAAVVVYPNWWCGEYVRREDGTPWINQDQAAEPGQVHQVVQDPRVRVSDQEMYQLGKAFAEWQRSQDGHLRAERQEVEEG